MEMVARRVSTQPRAPKPENRRKQVQGERSATALPTLFDDQPEDPVSDHSQDIPVQKLRRDTQR